MSLNRHCSHTIKIKMLTSTMNTQCDNIFIHLGVGVFFHTLGAGEYMDYIPGLKIAGGHRTLSLPTQNLSYPSPSPSDISSYPFQPGSCLAILENVLDTELILLAKKGLNDSSRSELSFYTKISTRNQILYKSCLEFYQNLKLRKKLF